MRHEPGDSRITYKPSGGSEQVWEINLRNPPWDVHKAAPKAAGFRGWTPFSEALGDSDADAWQALVWALRRRRETGLRFDSVEFPDGLAQEIDLAVGCPRGCGEWVEDERHECPPSVVEDDDEDADPEA